MFGSLTEKLQDLFSRLGKERTLTEEGIGEAMREVRLALLDADVNFSVVSRFIKRVKENAIGKAVLKSVKPAEQFKKLVHDELVELMGKEKSSLDIDRGFSVLMLCGLQGSGKTTCAAKLSFFIGKGKKVLLAACDLERPAAVSQLKTLGEKSGTEVFSLPGENDPLAVAEQALQKAKKEGFDVLIVDTAGRQHIDEKLMEELAKMKALLEPKEVLFVANATLGQEAVKIALEFDKKIEITGTILSMLDGNARAGAAISIREVTQKPLKFEGIGEKISDLQPFHPQSMADRILGMGDVINLVRRVEEQVSEKEKAELEKKLRKASFTYDDYLKQMKKIKRMGSFKGLLKMVPGLGNLGDMDFSEGEFTKVEAMICSMTRAEREERVELEHSRRRRISRGSGIVIEEINRMVKGFKRLKQMMKKMPAMQKSGEKMGGMPDLERFKKQFEGKKWH